MRALQLVLGSSPESTPIDSREAWLARHAAMTTVAGSTFEVAILGGFAADRVGYAFASGYQAALRALVPALPREGLVSFSVSERGGAHPRAIETMLEARPDGSYLLNGKKRWATLGGQSGVLLVAASTGLDASGRNALRVARVRADAPGVARTPMADPPFTPEIAHDEITLTNVHVSADDLCPGDGYARYVKPFRTIEDIHVHAAVMAYLVREVRAHALPIGLAERLAAVLVALGALAAEDPSAPETHIALAGVIDLARAPIEEIGRQWGMTESPEHARWERDRLLLTVASDVRGKRRRRAWDRLRGAPDDDSTTGPEST